MTDTPIVVLHVQGIEKDCVRMKLYITVCSEIYERINILKVVDHQKKLLKKKD